MRPCWYSISEVVAAGEGEDAKRRDRCANDDQRRDPDAGAQPPVPAADIEGVPGVEDDLTVPHAEAPDRVEVNAVSDEIEGHVGHGVDLGGFRVDVERHPDDHGAEVERAGDLPHEQRRPDIVVAELVEQCFSRVIESGLGFAFRRRF